MRKFSFLLVLFGLLFGWVPKVMAGNITSLDEITSGKAFTIKSPRGYLAAIGIDRAGSSSSCSNANALWTVYQNADGAYLYNIGAQMWLAIGNGTDANGLLVNTLAEAKDYSVSASDWGGGNAGLWHITVGGNTINMQGAGNAASINDWSSADDGNKMTIEVVRDVTAEEQVLMLDPVSKPSRTNALTDLGGLTNANMVYLACERGYVGQVGEKCYSVTWCDEGALWLIVNNNGTRYLFNVAAKKFASVDDGAMTFTGSPETAVTLTQWAENGNQWKVVVGSSVINMQNDPYVKVAAVNSYSTGDEGNKIYIIPANKNADGTTNQMVNRAVRTKKYMAAYNAAMIIAERSSAGTGAGCVSAEALENLKSILATTKAEVDATAVSKLNDKLLDPMIAQIEAAVAAVNSSFILPTPGVWYNIRSGATKNVTDYAILGSNSIGALPLVFKGKESAVWRLVEGETAGTYTLEQRSSAGTYLNIKPAFAYIYTSDKPETTFTLEYMGAGCFQFVTVNASNERYVLGAWDSENLVCNNDGKWGDQANFWYFDEVTEADIARAPYMEVYTNATDYLANSVTGTNPGCYLAEDVAALTDVINSTKAEFDSEGESLTKAKSQELQATLEAAFTAFQAKLIYPEAGKLYNIRSAANTAAKDRAMYYNESTIYLGDLTDANKEDVRYLWSAKKTENGKYLIQNKYYDSNLGGATQSGYYVGFDANATTAPVILTYQGNGRFSFTTSPSDETKIGYIKSYGSDRLACFAGDATEMYWYFEDVKDDAGRLDGALLTDASQISGNSLQVGDGSGFAALIDDNRSTYYHGAYNDKNGSVMPEELPYLQFNLGAPQKDVKMQFVSRFYQSAGYTDAPNEITILGTNTPDDEESWKVLTNLGPIWDSQVVNVCYETTMYWPEAYQYVRFLVNKTTTNRTSDAKYIFFTLSEINFFPSVVSVADLNAYIATVEAEIEAGYAQSTADTEGCYTDGTEAGYYVSNAQIADLKATIAAAKAAAEGAETVAYAVYADIVDAKAVVDACYTPLADGIYYIIHGYGDDSKKNGCAYTMTTVGNDNIVYKSQLAAYNKANMFKLTKLENGNYTLQNVATGAYIKGINGGKLVLTAEPTEQTIVNVLEEVKAGNLDTWSGKLNGVADAKRRARFNINEAGKDGYYQGAYNTNTAVTTVGTGGSWWMYGWMFRPVTAEALATAEKLEAIYAIADAVKAANYPDARQDKESQYYSLGTEKGRVVPGELLAALEAAQADAEAVALNTEATADEIDAAVAALQAAKKACDDALTTLNPLTDGYYYIIHGYADDSQKNGVAYALSANPANDTENVYKRALAQGDANFIWKLTCTDKANNLWSIQNVATGLYIEGLTEGQLKLAATATAQAITEVAESEWDGVNSIKNRTRYNIASSADASTYYYGPYVNEADGETTIGTSTAWWMYAWKFAPAQVEELEVSAIGYASAVYAQAVVVPAGLTACVVESVNDDAAHAHVVAYAQAGEVVPANTPVIFKGAQGAYALATTTGGEAPAKNLLCGDATKNTSCAGLNAYVLAASATDATKAVFSPVADNETMYIPAGKAYLPIATGASAAFYRLVFGDDVTGIDAATTTAAQGVYYNLNGQVVKNPVKGQIYILNGKKIVK